MKIDEHFQIQGDHKRGTQSKELLHGQNMQLRGHY